MEFHRMYLKLASISLNYWIFLPLESVFLSASGLSPKSVYPYMEGQWYLSWTYWKTSSPNLTPSPPYLCFTFSVNIQPFLWILWKDDICTWSVTMSQSTCCTAGSVSGQSLRSGLMVFWHYLLSCSQSSGRHDQKINQDRVLCPQMISPCCCWRLPSCCSIQ